MNFKNKLNNFIKNKDIYTEEIFEVINSKDWKTNIQEKNLIAFYIYLGNINLEVINNCFLNLNNILVFYNIKNKTNDKYQNNLFKIVVITKKINDIFLQKSYKYLMSFEQAMIVFIMRVINEKKIIISKNHPHKLQFKIQKIIDLKDNNYLNNIMENYFIINRIYFSEMINFINWLFLKNYINLSNFEDFGFIDKNVSNNYKNNKYKDYEIKNKKIVEEILECLKITNKYRNIISHNDNHFINKNNISEFVLYLNNQEKILKNNLALELKNEIANEIKKVLNESELILNKSFMKNFSDLFE